MKREIIRTPVGSLAVRVQGAGPTVVLIHGIPGSGDAWASVRDLLCDASFRVLVPDLIGFGSSARPTEMEDLWLHGQALALSAALDALADEPVILVGHDYGAPLAVLFARHYPERVKGLVLAAGNLFTDTPIPGPLRALRLPAIGRVAAAAALSTASLRMMLRFGVGRPRVQLDPAVYLGDRAQRAAIAWIFRNALSQLETRYAEVEAALPTLSQPAIVIWGDRDPFFAMREGERSSAAIPQSQLMIAKGAGHFLPAERPRLFVQAVVRLMTAPLSGFRS